MPIYSCEKCGRTFKQKSHYTDHTNKKIDCSQSTILSTVLETKVSEKIREAVKGISQAKEITSENLPAFFEDLHNLLWNKAGLNPEAALQHLTFFFAYRLIEIQADTLNLPQECRWSYIASIKNENDLDLAIKKGVSSFRAKPKTKAFFKPHDIQKAEIVYDIVQQINRVSLETLQETDTLGDIFEYMLSRGMSTMSDEGQYYTNRKICSLAFKLAYEIKQVLRRPDGTLCTFADWFCGTGGFPAEYIRGVKQNLKDVDWKKDSSSIYCQDMNVSSVTTTLLNLLIQTGVAFGNERIRSTNSFSDPITKGQGAAFPGLTIDYCFMNPPYGGDKSKGKEYKFSYSKKVKDESGNTVKKFFVNEDIQSVGVEDDDKVSAGVQLAMATLAPGGVCAIVLPQGFFFGASKKCVELRKKIAEDYKIWYVVDIASGSFINTGTKTSMMVFQKGVGPTETVSFIGLDEKLLIKATIEDLRAKHYSLNYKQYLPQTAVEVEGFEMVKLGDVIIADSGDLLAKDSIVKGDYPIIGGGKVVGYHNKTNRNADEIVISRVGNACLTFMSSKYYLTDNALAIISKNQDKMLVKYLYYYLTQNVDKLREQYSGTAQPVISKTRLYEIQIPLPSLERQHQIVEAIDGWTNLAQNEEVSLKMLEKQMMFQVKEIGKGQARVKLGEVCDVNSGQSFRKEDIISGNIPVIGGGKIVGYHNQSNRPGNEFSITRVGDCCLNWFNTPYMLTEHGFSITLKDASLDKYLLNTIYYHFNNIKEDLILQYDGTAQKLITKTKLREFDIPTFKLDEVTQLQSDFDEIRHKHAKIATYKAKAQEAIQRLIPGA
jgi:type I restriction enzyme S subunit